MNLYFRLLWLLLTGRRKGPADVLDEMELTFRVLPNDLDVNMHMNNGRYATIMDLGRIDMMQRIGLFRHVVKNKWMPILAAEELQFLRPLKLFQTYTLATRLLHWDDKWFYFEQKFRSNDKEIARAVVKTQLRKGRMKVSAEEIMEKLKYTGTVPDMPETYKHWLAHE